MEQTPRLDRPRANIPRNGQMTDVFAIRSKTYGSVDLKITGTWWDAQTALGTGHWFAPWSFLQSLMDIGLVTVEGSRRDGLPKIVVRDREAWIAITKPDKGRATVRLLRPSTMPGVGTSAGRAPDEPSTSAPSGGPAPKEGGPPARGGSVPMDWSVLETLGELAILAASRHPEIPATCWFEQAVRAGVLPSPGAASPPSAPPAHPAASAPPAGPPAGPPTPPMPDAPPPWDADDDDLPF